MIREFKFRKVYEMASRVELYAFESDSSYGEINWNAPNIVLCICKPLKASILHHYINAVIAVSERENYRDNSDSYCEIDHDPEVTRLEQIFREYEISVEPFKAYLENAYPNGDTDANDPFYEWFVCNEDGFELLWEKITEEVFHILFGNRTFLLQFNLALADYLRYSSVKIPPQYLDKKGVIKRQHIPQWVKKAVYFRDQGRCVLCQKDLSGLLSTDRSLQYDHIVPLNLWGTNDPCNIQLLCDKCNNSKSGDLIKTGLKYASWWDY
ncbi:MAG TPA: HNH endonuclease [Phototrophicaceae bacterium]|nr:HNH endonuclease [Phototrophicaceae bacterium]